VSLIAPYCPYCPPQQQQQQEFLARLNQFYRKKVLTCAIRNHAEPGSPGRRSSSNTIGEPMRILNNIVPGLLAVVSLLSFWGCGKETQEVAAVRPVKILTLGAVSRSEGRTFPGTLRAAERAQLSFRVSGPLIQLPVKEGQQVKKGQLLAQIDTPDFETRVKNLEANLATLRADRRAMDRARPEDIRRLEAGMADSHEKDSILRTWNLMRLPGLSSNKVSRV